jgi:hypothetical protein
MQDQKFKIHKLIMDSKREYIAKKMCRDQNHQFKIRPKKRKRKSKRLSKHKKYQKNKKFRQKLLMNCSLNKTYRQVIPLI